MGVDMEGDDNVGEAKAVTAGELVIILGQYHSAIARLGSGIISLSGALKHSEDVDVKQAADEAWVKLNEFIDCMEGYDRKGGAGGGGNGGENDLEKRISQVEARLERIETKLDGMQEHMATKSDLMQTKIDLLEATSRLDLSIANFRTDMQSLETRLLKWFVGTAGALSAIAFGVARLVH
eukprot:gene11840-18259_t